MGLREFPQKLFLLCRRLNTMNLIKELHSINRLEYIFWKSCLNNLMTSSSKFFEGLSQGQIPTSCYVQKFVNSMD